MAVRPAGTHFSSVSRRRITSVVFDRRLIIAFLTAWGVFLHLFDGSTGLLFGLYSRRVFIWLNIQGWLAAPLILTCSLVLFCARETPILAGGIGVARCVAGAVLSFFLVDWAS